MPIIDMAARNPRRCFQVRRTFQLAWRSAGDMNKLSNAVTLPFLCCICSGIISFSNSFSVRLASSIDTAYFHFVAFFILYNSRHLLLQRYRNISIIGTSRDSSLECNTAEAQGPDAARRALDDHKRRKKQNSDRTVTFFAMPSTHWQSLSYRELLAPIENSIFSFCQKTRRQSETDQRSVAIGG